MKRLFFLFALVIFFFGCSQKMKTARSADTTEARPMNVLMIAIDDMNSWIGSMGGPALTPHMDRLATEGVLFDNAYCVVPACNPSRTALFTGMRPETTGQYGNPGDFREKPGGAALITLPQYLQEQGYETVAAGKIFHKHRGSGTEADPQSDPASWDEQWVGHIGTKGMNLYTNDEGLGLWHDGTIGNYLGKYGVWGVCPEPTEETGDMQLASWCADYLQQKHDKPFFLACGIFRPHSPQLAPQEFFDLYPPEDVTVPELPADDLEDVPQSAHRNFSTPFVEKVLEKEQLPQAMRAYLASMSFADACVGRVLDALDKSPYKDNTIVVLWSDHGWQLAHKMRWEKYSLWKQATNAPMMIRYPGMAHNEKISESVSYLDLYPTVLDLLGVPKPDFLEGQTLVPLLANADHERMEPAVITYPEGSHSVVLDEWNYIHYSNGAEELYNHDTDPNEFTNLAGQPQYRELMDQLKDWLPE